MTVQLITKENYLCAEDQLNIYVVKNDFLAQVSDNIRLEITDGSFQDYLVFEIIDLREVLKVKLRSI